MLQFFREKNVKKCDSLLKHLEYGSLEYKFYDWELRNLKFGKVEDSLHNSLINSTAITYSDSIFQKMHDASFFFHKNEQSKAFSHLDDALEISLKQVDSLLSCRILYDILVIIGRNPKLRKLNSDYVNKYYQLAPDNYEMVNAMYFDFSLNYRHSKEKLELKNSALNLAHSLKSKFPLMELEQRIGIVYDIYLKKKDSAKFFYEDALGILDSFGKFNYTKQRKKGLLNNLGCIYFDLGEYKKALGFFDRAFKIKSPKKRLVNDSIIVDWKRKIHKILQNQDSALYYCELNLKISKELAQEKYAAEIEEQKRKYNNEKLRADNLIIEQKRVKNRNWLIVATLALLLGTGIAILIQKNTTKKRQLAEQQAILKQQRVDNLLKEQELVSIDAMIAGQEKERQKVAGELHDDLGSLMATIKLHFDNAKVGKKDPALQNAQKLLEEAYQKIRGMAHSKNSGVMSDQGLLSAVQKMAQTISETNTMKVTVEDFGLGERLENSLELSIFRMVQELVANAIKHAKASKVNIQLTQHEDNLNIIVEDNGKGFDRSKLDKSKSGMGLTTIEKRVEHLEGNFTVDSIVGKGTSILIDIPV